MKSLLRYLFVSHRLVTAVFVVLVLCIVAGWWYSSQASVDFATKYSLYIVRASIQQNAAFVPGATDNTFRSLLNQDLALVLAKETSPKDRLILSEHGLELLTQVNKQVESMGDEVESINESINSMEISAHGLGNIFHRSTQLKVVLEAKKEMETINQIRALSYRANFETGQIFKRVITDKGVLTDSYINELNAHIPDVEEQFNKRENAYTELQKEIVNVQNTSLELGLKQI